MWLLSDDDIHIRLANSSDMPVLLSLLIEFHHHLQIPIVSQDTLYSALEMLMKDPMCDFTIAVAMNGSGLAYSQIRYFYSLWSLGLEAKLEDLYVTSKVRRQGLGRQLLTFSSELARRRQCRLIALNTNERNIPAKSLYNLSDFSCRSSRWQGGQQLWFEKIL